MSCTGGLACPRLDGLCRVTTKTCLWANPLFAYCEPVSSTKLAQNRLGDVVLIGLLRKRSERAAPCENILYRQRSVRGAFLISVCPRIRGDA
jgi:hypothetical protein